LKRKVEAATFNVQPVHDQNGSFRELVSTLAKYDVVDLLSTVGGLQLLRENASRVTRLEALSHSVASLPPNVGPKISSAKLRRICTHPSLESLAPYEDPAENQFAEEFTFFGGSYLVYPGIAQAGEFMLSNLCKAIFLDPRQSLPQRFRSRAFRLVSSALHVIDAVAKKAGIGRGTAPVSDRYGPIVVPDAGTLRKLKNAVSFTTEEIESLLGPAGPSPRALDPLVSRMGAVNLEDYDVVNGPLLWRPLVDCDGTIVVVIPGMVVSATRQALLHLAYEENLQAELAETYNRAVWENVEESLRFTRNIAFPHRLGRPLNIPNASEGFFNLDHDKVLYCLLVTDPLTRPVISDPFGLWTDDALSDSINQRISQVERDVLGVSPAPNDLFIVVAFQGLGGSAAFGLDRTAANSHSIALSAEALRVISLLEGGDPLALFNFARARDQARERSRITATNVLDEFYLYRKNEYSFYFSDQAPPDFIMIPPGDSLNLQMEIARERDFHASRMVDGSTAEVTSLHGTASIPIYSPVADLGERIRLLVEGLPVLIWITGPAGDADPEEHRIYALFADAVSFWIWQFTPVLVPLLSALENSQPIEIQMNLPAHDAWHSPGNASLQPGAQAVDAKVDTSRHLIEVTVNEQLIPLFQTADNRGERALMQCILNALSQLIPKSSPHALTPVAIENALGKIAPLGMKKMLLLFDSARTPEIDDRGLPQYRPLRKVWVNSQLDHVGQHLIADSGLKVGDIDVEQRTPILNGVALECFSQLQRIAATLSPRGLLRFVAAHSESVHREQAMNRLTIPTRLECFRSDPEMIEQLAERIPELANVGLASRFLVEYIVAQPPAGLRPMSLDLYDEMRAWSYHCLNYAMLSDAVHFGIEEYSLSLLPSERLGIGGSASQRAMSSHMRAFALDQIGGAPENFKRQWEPIVPTLQGERFRTELDAATAVEFGVPLSELLELMEFAISVGQESPPGIMSLREDTFIEAAAKAMERGEDRLWSALDLLSLGPRPSFWTPPNGYAKADLYPWRYNRPLSYMRRPFLHYIHEDVSEITWGFRHVRAAQRFLVDQCTSGKLKARTPQMRSFMSRLLNAQGEAFNKKVSAFFEGLEGLVVGSRVKKVGSLRELQDHLGDIDVLVGDIRRQRILVIECKDLSAARTPYEMANEFTELFVGNHGKKSVVSKHQARAYWVESNVGAVVAFLKLSPKKRWKIIPLIVVDQPLVASYIRESPIQVLSFEEIRRFWPDLRRA
jgi:hypothetical protein